MNQKNIIFVLLFLAGCTQPAAPIAMKGKESFSKSGSSTNGRYATGNDPSAYTPTISPETYQNVAVDSIGVNDLSAPIITNKPILSKQPAPLSAPAPTAPAASSVSAPEPAPVNSWTNRPRNLNEQIEPHADATVSVPATQAIAEVSEVKSIAKSEAKTEVKPIISSAKASETNSFQWPVASKKIISSFGDKGAGQANDGIIIAANDGEAVHAAAGGEVLYVGDELKGYGNMVIIKHSGGKSTSYAHLGRATVDKYDRVSQGDVIGYVGKTGSVKTPQLFFSLRNGKQAIDPAKYMSNEVAGL